MRCIIGCSLSPILTTHFFLDLGVCVHVPFIGVFTNSFFAQGVKACKYSHTARYHSHSGNANASVRIFGECKQRVQHSPLLLVFARGTIVIIFAFDYRRKQPCVRFDSLFIYFEEFSFSETSVGYA